MGKHVCNMGAHWCVLPLLGPHTRLCLNSATVCMPPPSAGQPRTLRCPGSAWWVQGGLSLIQEPSHLGAVLAAARVACADSMHHHVSQAALQHTPSL
jgi:hypothetical protein